MRKPHLNVILTFNKKHPKDVFQKRKHSINLPTLSNWKHIGYRMYFRKSNSPYSHLISNWPGAKQILYIPIHHEISTLILKMSRDFSTDNKHTLTPHCESVEVLNNMIHAAEPHYCRITHSHCYLPDNSIKWQCFLEKWVKTVC